MRRHRADEILPIPRSRDAAYAIFCVVARTDDWRVTNPAGQLVCRTAGRGCCSDVPLGVEGDGADSAMRSTRMRSDPSASDRLELCSTIVSMEIVVRYQLHSLLERKLLATRADEHHMWCLLHDVPRQFHRVPYAREARNGPRFLIPTIHDRRIELRCSIAREARAASRVEQRIVLQHTHGDSDRIETGTTAVQNVEAGIEDAPETRFEVSARMCSETPRNDARTRMNDQGMNEPSPPK